MAISGKAVVRIDTESDISQRLMAERARLRLQAGLDRPRHFHRPVERPFTAEERDRVTILFGGLTWKHEELIKAVFQGSRYCCVNIPVPDVARPAHGANQRVLGSFRKTVVHPLSKNAHLAAGPPSPCLLSRLLTLVSAGRRFHQTPPHRMACLAAISVLDKSAEECFNYRAIVLL